MKSIEKVDRFIESYLHWILILLFMLFVIAPVSFSKYSLGKFFDLSSDETSNIGNTINGLTAPFLSLITIVLIYATYRSQKKELEETKTALAKQQFETTLHQLISNLKEQVIKIDSSGFIHFNTYFQKLYERCFKPSNGKQSILGNYERLFNDRKKGEKIHDHIIESSKTKLQSTLMRFEPGMREYAFKLKLIIDYINESDILEKERINYYKILFFSMNAYEIYFLRYMIIRAVESKAFNELLKDKDLLIHDLHAEPYFKIYYDNLGKGFNYGELD